MKVCSTCKIEKPLDEFYKDKRVSSGLKSSCKECQIQRVREYRDRNPEQYSRWRKEFRNKNPRYDQELNLKKLYKMSLDEYDRLLALQDGVCAICGNEDSKALAVDHDSDCCKQTPTCGECTRGLLCQMCNRALGGFRHSAKTITKAAEYLTNYITKEQFK